MGENLWSPTSDKAGSVRIGSHRPDAFPFVAGEAMQAAASVVPGADGAVFAHRQDDVIQQAAVPHTKGVRIWRQG